MRFVPVFYMLDLDRCLLDTPRFQETFIDCLDRYEIVPRQKMQEAQQAIETAGGSFDTVTYLQDLIGEDVWQEAKKPLLKEMQGRASEMLLGDAADFLHRLQKAASPFCIMTYGGYEWQMLKLDVLGLSQLPHVITGSKYKGQLIAQYFDAQTHTCIFPGDVSGEPLRVERVYLVDDKAVSFDELPSNGYGYWLVPDEKNLLASQQGEVGERVQKVASLKEVTL